MTAASKTSGMAPVTEIQAKRAYEAPEKSDGYRVLIDHIWPRGVSRERAKLDEWAKELAPSGELRKWFSHDPDRFEEFRRRYRAELKERGEKLDELRRRARKGPLTVVYAARDEEHNNAVVLAELLREERRRQGAGVEDQRHPAGRPGNHRIA